DEQGAGANALHRRDIDDAAGAGLFHALDSVFAAEKGALTVDAHVGPPLVETCRLDMGGAGNPGALHQNVQGSEGLLHLGDGALPVPLGGDIQRGENTPFPQLRRQRLAGGGVDVGDGHPCPFRREHPRHTGADTGGTAGNHGDLAVQSSHCGFSNLSLPGHRAVQPPSAVNSAPVVKEARSDASHRAAWAISPGVPRRLMGCRACRAAPAAGPVTALASIGVRIWPAHRPLLRIPDSPYATSAVRVMPATANLLAT